MSTKPETAEREELIALAFKHTVGGLEFDENGLISFAKEAAALLAADGKAGGEVVAWATMYAGKASQLFKGPDAEYNAKREIQRLNREYPNDRTKRSAAPLYTRPQQAAQVAQPLTVWFDQMPESNGKRNWTVMLRRKDSEGLLGGIAYGVCFERTEYYDRARYAADRLRFLIGELDKEPDVLNYDPTILQSGEAAHGIGKDQS